MDTQTLLKTMSDELQLSQAELVQQSVFSYLEGQLRQIKAEIFQITGQYQVANVQEMEARYEAGTLAEAETWRDLQRLDHLEYKRDHLLKLLESIQ